MEEFYFIDSAVSKLQYDGLNTQKLKNTFGIDCIVISLEKGHLLPEHNSPKNTNIYVVEGAIDFSISGKKYRLNAQDWFRFPKDEAHSVKAVENTKLLVLR